MILQALFVARRTYPLADNKWIREQVAEWLSLPDSYEELPPILSVRRIEGAELAENAVTLRVLLKHWTCLGGWRPRGSPTWRSTPTMRVVVKRVSS